MLKRTPSLTEQVKTHLKQRILNGDFDGGRIPSETDLADELGVSRTTVRDALSRLEGEGVVTRKQGAGTFVNRIGLQIQTRLEEMWDYEAVLAAHGYTPSTRILKMRRDTADTQTAAALNLSPGDPLLSVQKLFLADDEPVILAFNHIPATLVDQPFTADDFHMPVYRFLWQFGRQRLSYYLSEIVPAVATPELAQTLHVPPQTALISFDEVGYKENNDVILKARSYFRDDLLRFRLIRRQV